MTRPSPELKQRRKEPSTSRSKTLKVATKTKQGKKASCKETKKPNNEPNQRRKTPKGGTRLKKGRNNQKRPKPGAYTKRVKARKEVKSATEILKEREAPNTNTEAQQEREAGQTTLLQKREVSKTDTKVLQEREATKTNTKKQSKTPNGSLEAQQRRTNEKPHKTQQQRREYTESGTSRGGSESTTGPHTDPGVTKEAPLHNNQYTPGYYTLFVSSELSYKPHNFQCSSNRNPVSTSSQNCRMLILQAYYHVSHKMNRGYAQKCLSPIRVYTVALKNSNNCINQNSKTNTDKITPVCMQVIRMYDHKPSLSIQTQRPLLRMHVQKFPLSIHVHKPSLNRKTPFRMHAHNLSPRMYVQKFYLRKKIHQKPFLRMHASLNTPKKLSKKL